MLENLGGKQELTQRSFLLDIEGGEVDLVLVGIADEFAKPFENGSAADLFFGIKVQILHDGVVKLRRIDTQVNFTHAKAERCHLAAQNEQVQGNLVGGIRDRLVQHGEQGIDADDPVGMIGRQYLRSGLKR